MASSIWSSKWDRSCCVWPHSETWKSWQPRKLWIDWIRKLTWRVWNWLQRWILRQAFNRSWRCCSRDIDRYWSFACPPQNSECILRPRRCQQLRWILPKWVELKNNENHYSWIKLSRQTTTRLESVTWWTAWMTSWRSTTSTPTHACRKQFATSSAQLITTQVLVPPIKSNPWSRQSPRTRSSITCSKELQSRTQLKTERTQPAATVTRSTQPALSIANQLFRWWRSSCHFQDVRTRSRTPTTTRLWLPLRILHIYLFHSSVKILTYPKTYLIHSPFGFLWRNIFLFSPNVLCLQIKTRKTFLLNCGVVHEKILENHSRHFNDKKNWRRIKKFPSQVTTIVGIKTIADRFVELCSFVICVRV